MTEPDYADLHKHHLELLRELGEISQKNDLRYYLVKGALLGTVRNSSLIPWDADVDIYVPVVDYENFTQILSANLSAKYQVKTTQDPSYEKLMTRVTFAGSSHREFHLDVFPLVGAPTGAITRRFFSLACHFIYKAYFAKKVSPTEWYYSRRRMKALAQLSKIALFWLPASTILKVYKYLSLLIDYETSTQIRNVCGSSGLREHFPKAWFEEPTWLKLSDMEIPAPTHWHAYLTHMYGDYKIPRASNYETRQFFFARK